MRNYQLLFFLHWSYNANSTTKKEQIKSEESIKQTTTPTS